MKIFKHMKRKLGAVKNVMLADNYLLITKQDINETETEINSEYDLRFLGSIQDANHLEKTIGYGLEKLSNHLYIKAVTNQNQK
jgi:hypothetical protein